MDFLLKTRMNLEGLDLATSSGQDSTKSQVSREAGSIPVSLCPSLHNAPVPCSPFGGIKIDPLLLPAAPVTVKAGTASTLITALLPVPSAVSGVQ